ncbi:ATP-binding protein [Candidatus Sumerlaeota bacterium]|nr:ATP-binding protein [Candidatus Sumerlaeota bacterium]
MQISKGKQQRAQRVVVYGPEGIGKSTFASKFPNPLFVDTEGGTDQLDIARTEKPQSWAMLGQILQHFNLDQQGFKTLIIDTIDWAELLCIAHICSEAGKAGIEDFGYGKGYTYLAESFGKFLNFLNEVRDKGVNVVLLAHAQMRKFEQPDETGAYDRWELKLSKKCVPLVKEWADMVLFANYKTLVVEVDGKKKAQGGQRVMHVNHHPCWDAKNRHGLPDELPFEYGKIAHLFTVSVQTPASAPAPAPVPAPVQQAPVPTPEPASAQYPVPAIAPALAPVPVPPADGIPPQLMQLMSSAGITVDQVQSVVAQRGYYTKDTPICNYDPKFIDGVLVAAWDKVVEAIRGGNN